MWECLRHNLVLETRYEEDRQFGDGGEECFRRPHLMAEEREVFCGWHDTAEGQQTWTRECLELKDIPGYQLAHAQESILQHQTNQSLVILVLCRQLNADRTSQTLAKNDNVMISSFCSFPQIIIGGLRVNHDATLVCRTSRKSIAPVFQHENVAAHLLNQHARDWQSVTYVARIAVEH